MNLEECLEIRLLDGRNTTIDSIDDASKLLKKESLLEPRTREESKHKLINYIVDLSKKYQYESQHDKLTGLYNQSYFKSRLEDEVTRAKRYGEIFSIVLFDLDNFKTINDEFGHLSGDMSLRKVATVMKYQTRESDIIARYGGDEFAMILPHTNLDDAIHTSRKIRTMMNRTAYKNDKVDLKLGASFGVAQYCHGITADALFSWTDEALYKSKDQGKNTITSREIPKDEKNLIIISNFHAKKYEAV